MLGTFWQPCPPGGGGGREREKERRLLLLGLTWNAITFDTPPAFEKTSHPAWFGRPIEQKWNPNRPTIYFGKELYIIAQNNAGKMATRKGHHPYSLKKWLEDGFRNLRFSISLFASAQHLTISVILLICFRQAKEVQWSLQKTIYPPPP